MAPSHDDSEFWRRRLAAIVQGEKIWQAELDRRREVIARQTEQLAAAERNQVALEAVRQQLSDQVAALHVVVEDREREIRRLFEEVSKAHRQLQELWSSFSWRATIPLRSISARLPGVAQSVRQLGQRYPALWETGAGSIRAAGRALLLKSTPAESQEPPLQEPATPLGMAVDLSPADPTTAPPRPQRWLAVGDGFEPRGRSEGDRPSPIAGDHVLFTGATSTWPNNDRLLSLIDSGIDFSLRVDEVPLDLPEAWLRTALTHARRLSVREPAQRDRLLRWAVLSDVYVSAAVCVEHSEPDAAAVFPEEASPAVPLEQFGRSFVPGIVAPETLHTLALAQAWCTETDPQVSIVIVSRNPYMTRACVQHVWAYTAGIRYEIVLADGGGPSVDRRILGMMGRGVRVLPVGPDCFFGEACNVAAEQVRTPLICFLDHDCFVQPGWLPPLVDALEADATAAAAGPLLIAADTQTWEAGGTVTEAGDLAPLGQGGALDAQPQPVDYASSAVLLVRRDAFLRAGGYDLMFEPEMFEDVDLGFKLKALGFSVLSCTSAYVFRSRTDDIQSSALADMNRSKFVARWRTFLHGRAAADLAEIGRDVLADAPASTADAALPTAVLYTPYPITPGGGERFLLTMALELARDHRVTIATPSSYSQMRLHNIAHTFGIDLSRVRLQTAAAFAAGPAPDLMVALSNFIFPPVPARGPNAVYICQFPFPLEGHPPRIDQGYRAVVAYSAYARAHILAALRTHGMPSWPVEIVYPPVPQLDGATPKRPIVLTVGRFFAGDHNKRHDLMIEAFRRVHDEVGVEVEMHLVGSSTPGEKHLRYMESLKQAAGDMPVYFHVNASPDTLKGLYRDALIYWHATGLGVDLEQHPERAEHFGISLVEAMSSECLSLAFDAGGPKEIITSGVDGFLYSSIDELVTRTVEMLGSSSSDRWREIGRAAAERARSFAPDRFAARVREVLLPSVGDIPPEQGSGSMLVTGRGFG